MIHLPFCLNNQTPPELPYWLALANIAGVGPRFFERMLGQGLSPKQLLLQTPVELSNLGFNQSWVNALSQPDWNAVEQLINWQQEKAHRTILMLNDERYPPALRAIPDPPALIFAEGNLNLLAQPQIAMVGSRNPSHLGQEIAFDFSVQLAVSGLTITSGLALGIDSASHEGALHGKGGTIAVLGSGLNHIYPRKNNKLAQKIIEQDGLLLSEFSPSTPPKAENFPRRNRIISGLSVGVVIVEAALRSGSLITARFALEQGREVFAIPGCIHNPQSKGCHALIRQGAKLVETVADILEELTATLQVHIEPPISEKKLLKLTPKQQDLLDCIDYSETSLETISQRSGLTIAQASSMLVILEIEGYIQTASYGYSRSK